MAESKYDALIDYSGYIDEQARNFYGRNWLFADLVDWLAKPDGPRFFAVTGEPGSGKTALAARLAQFASGKVKPPARLRRLGPDFLSAIHFCANLDLRWIGDRRWFHPHVFAESLARQLAARYPEYAQALVEKSSGRRIVINVEQHIKDASGQVTGIEIKNLDVSRLNPEDAFIYVVREPLEELLKQRPSQQIVILVDALDEALRYSGSVNIVSLLVESGSLNTGVRFIVTARPGLPQVEALAHLSPPAVQLYPLSQEPGLSHSRDDIRKYVLHIAETPRYAGLLSPELTPKAFAEAVRDKSEGNFLYVKQLLPMLEAQPEKITQKSLDTLPKGLSNFYREFLRQIMEQSNHIWEERYAPVIGILAVAREALGREQLATFTSLKRSQIVPILSSLRQLLDYDPNLLASQRIYSIFHRSFADFVLDEDQAEDYWSEATEQHERIADYYLQQWRSIAGSDDEDTYGLRYIAVHLAEAARGRRQPVRHQHTVKLVDQFAPAFQRHHQEVIQNLPRLQRDLERVLRCAAEDNHPAAPALVVKAAGYLQSFRAAYLRPEAVFDLARAGAVDQAAQQLELFAAEPKWEQCALLAIAWLVADLQPPVTQDPAMRRAASALLEHVRGSQGLAAPLPELVARVDAALRGAPFQVSPSTQVPTADIVQEIVARIGGERSTIGEPVTNEMLQAYAQEPLDLQSEVLIQARAAGGDEESLYVAALEGPALVAYAAQHADQPGGGDHVDYLAEYIAIHAANDYVQYRNGTLWVLLDAVLKHPKQEWVRDKTVALISAALASGRLEFREGLPLTILALHARADYLETKQQFQAVEQKIHDAIGHLMPERGRGDTWGQHKRRLIALAQVYARVLGRSDITAKLLDQALYQVRFGYAGFQSPAYLSLAEAFRICQLDNVAARDEALEQAQKAAHHIQDAHFCAQTTARWNAMVHRWWRRSISSDELAKLIGLLISDSSTPQFAALHIRGETYQHRSDGRDNFPLSDRVRSATTLDDLAWLYQRSPTEFRRFNPDDDGTSPEVNVPDPGFAPLLAARLAAEALVAPALSSARRVSLVQALVPVAAPNPTALDTVLSRLILAAAAAGWVDDTALVELRTVLESLSQGIMGLQIYDPEYAEYDAKIDSDLW